MPTSRIASLFQRVIGPRFLELPPELQRIHDDRPHVMLAGVCDVERGANPLIALIALMASLPPTGGKVRTTVRIDRDAHGETWTRNFGGHQMRSRLWTSDGLLMERLGLVKLAFNLQVETDRIEWRVARARVMGLRLPAGWFSSARATEQVIGGEYRFDVRVTMPIVGLLVNYRGTLVESRNAGGRFVTACDG